MPLDRSNHSQENGNSGRIKLVLRLDKGKNADAEPPANDSRPKRSPHPKTMADDFLPDKKIPKKQLDPLSSNHGGAESPQDEHRPSRKRKSTMDANFVFDPIYSKKKGESSDVEDEDEEEEEYKKQKKKPHRSNTKGGWEIVTSPSDEKESFKLKIKPPKNPLPDTPDQINKKKVEPGSGDAKKKKKTSEEEVDHLGAALNAASRSGNLKIKINTSNMTSPAADKKSESSGGSAKRVKQEATSTPGGTTKRHSSPPKRLDVTPEKKETKPEVHERPQRTKPTPEPKSTAPALEGEDATKMKKHLSGVLSQLIKIDRQYYFTEPVTEDIAPQYFTIIKQPMDFKTMKKKLKDGKYNSVEALQEDFELICNNCMTYNPPTSTYAKEAKRMLNVGNRIFEKLSETPSGTTTEHKQEDKKKEVEKTPTRQTTPSSTPTKATPVSKPATPSTPSHPITRSNSTPAANSSLGVAFPISSGQLSSMQHPISTTPQHAYPVTPTGLRKPPAYPPMSSPYSPRIGLPQATTSITTTPMRAPNAPLPLQKSQSTNSMLPRPPLGAPQPPIPVPPRPTSGPVGKPGSRPPVVSMTDNQATQTQAMFPEQPKRKYVKLPVEEPPKPAPPSVQAKTPAKLVAKVGTIPLVSPANVPGSFVYSMYIPRFEAGSLPVQKTETSPSSPPLSPPATTTDSIQPTTTSPISSSTTLSKPPSTAAPANYINNYDEDEWRTPKRNITENMEVMEAIASDSLAAIDANTRSQLVDFFSSFTRASLANQPLSFPAFASSSLLPRSPLSSLIKPIHKQALPTTPTPPTTTTTTSTSPTVNLDAELTEQINKLDSFEFTEQDLKQLQGLPLDLDLLSAFLPSSTPSTPATPAPVSPPIASSFVASPPTVASPPLEPMDIFTSPPTSPPTTTTTTLTTTTTTTTATPTLKRKTTLIQPEPAKARKMVQEILDKNLEYLWALQLMQHERVSTIPSEAELKLASHISDGLFALGTSVPPSMLTSKEGVRAAIENSGLVTGKHRHMRI